MEGDLNEMEIQLSHANRHASEATKTTRSLQIQIKVLFEGANREYSLTNKQKT